MAHSGLNRQRTGFVWTRAEEFICGLRPLIDLSLSSNPLSYDFDLHYDRAGVFAGVRCRKDSLTGKDLEHWCSTADAVPVTYKQVFRTAGTGWDETHGAEHLDLPRVG